MPPTDPLTLDEQLAYAREIIALEARTLAQLSVRLDERFTQAVALLRDCSGTCGNQRHGQGRRHRAQDHRHTHVDRFAQRVLGPGGRDPRRPRWNSSRARGSHGTGTIELIVRHRFGAGRIIVALDERTILSKPLVAASALGRPVVHRLSVAAGRHDVRVEILNSRGLIHVVETMAADIRADSTIRLDVEHQEGTPHTINLTLSSEDEAGAPAAH